MGVIDGTPVDALHTNVFLDKNEDSTGVGKIELANTDPVSGAVVSNLQREHNSAASFMGKTLNAAKDALPAWVSSEIGTPTDSLKARADALTAEFNGTLGHTHDGASGNGPKISAANLAAVPLRGFVQQGTDLLAVTGSSTVVTAQFTGKTAGGSNLQTGVVTAAPYNKVVIRQASGANENDPFVDGSANIVYGRLTEAASVWTLNYFTLIGSTETAYSFSTASSVRFYYQEIYNPLAAGAPTYSEFAFIPSDSATGDVNTATTAVQGKVSLAVSAQNVSSATSAGTANAIVANADHTHRGIASVVVGASTFYGDLTVTASGGASLTPGSGTIDIATPALTSSAPNDIGSAAAVGVAITSARADHTHRGVSSVAKSGSSSLYGAVTLSASGGVTLTQAGQDIQIDAPALASVAPNDIATTNQVGVGATAARYDHTHKGVRSVGVTSQPQLFGDIVLASSGTGVSLSQVGNTITIVGSGGGGGGGGSAVWYAPGLYAPIETEENNQNVFLFPQNGDARLVIFLRIPQGYVAGTQAFCYVSQYSPSSSGTQLMRSTTYLIRTGVDAVGSVANAFNSTNTALTNTVANQLRTSALDLTNGSGQINGLSPSAGDLLRIELFRPTGIDTDTADVRVIPSASELKLT